MVFAIKDISVRFFFSILFNQLNSIQFILSFVFVSLIAFIVCKIRCCILYIADIPYIAEFYRFATAIRKLYTFCPRLHSAKYAPRLPHLIRLPLHSVCHFGRSRRTRKQSSPVLSSHYVKCIQMNEL